jgi:hypothetical protein
MERNEIFLRLISAYGLSIAMAAGANDFFHYNIGYETPIGDPGCW